MSENSKRTVGLAVWLGIIILILGQAATARPIKAVHFVLGPSDPDAVAVKYEYAMRILDLAGELGYNTIVLQIANGVKFDSVPALARRGAWSKQQLKQFADTARARGMDIVPEFKFLTHQEKFLAREFPDLLYNAVTYDPRIEETYEVVFAVLDEIIALIDPAAINIGHDEVVGWNPHHARRHLGPGETMLPAELFLHDVTVLHDYLGAKNIETWMWGDMLLSPDEFPGYESTYFHGTVAGYGAELRRRIPRSIIICDWQYSSNRSDYPSIQVFKSDGFRVIGAVWEDEAAVVDFTRRAAGSSALGMIATTWFYVPQQRWDRIERIMRNSARAFQVLDQDRE